jgi:hypothetical protein
MVSFEGIVPPFSFYLEARLVCVETIHRPL